MKKFIEQMASFTRDRLEDLERRVDFCNISILNNLDTAYYEITQDLKWRVDEILNFNLLQQINQNFAYLPQNPREAEKLYNKLDNNIELFSKEILKRAIADGYRKLIKGGGRISPYSSATTYYIKDSSGKKIDLFNIEPIYDYAFRFTCFFHFLEEKEIESIKIIGGGYSCTSCEGAININKINFNFLKTKDILVESINFNKHNKE
jgi:hypothetical protein